MRPPRRAPGLIALLCYALVVAVMFWPFWTGHFLINPASDMRNGYPFRLFESEFGKRFGGFPQWNPYIFGGMPFLGAIGGDVFYPTFLLRLALPVDAGITLGFMLHILLAGAFTYLFLRSLGLSWGAAFVGGAAYMLSGQVVSLVSPGHDGKLFVSALLPLALWCLHGAVTRNSLRGYAYFGGVVGLSLISPHFQATYYLLMAAGFYWAFLVFASDERLATPVPWWQSAIYFVVALGIGFAFAAIQLLPFKEYLAGSARGAGGTPGVDAWAYHTAWSMPPEELLDGLWPAFSGMLESYWGRNPFKLHSEYLGVVALILASFAPLLKERRRTSWFFAFLAAYGVLFALGSYTPFYYIPYAILPGIKLTRAPSIIFFLTSFSVAVLAAIGVERLESWPAGMGTRRHWWWAGGLAVAMLLAFAGVFEGLMRAIASPERAAAVTANYPAFMADAIRVAVLGVAAAALIAWRLSGKAPTQTWALAVGGLVLLDLWSVERRYVAFSPPAHETFAADAVVSALERDSSVFRVAPLNTYPGRENYLMAHDVRSVLGYHGNEPHRYDELLGGKNEWRNIGNLNVLRLLAVKYLILPQTVQASFLAPIEVPGSTSGDTLSTIDGQRVFLYRVTDALPYAFLTAGALEMPDSQTLSVLLDPRFDPQRLLLVAPGQGAGVATLKAMPPAVPVDVRVHQLRPGALAFTLPAATAEPTYLFVSENYDPNWHATVDGQRAPVLLAQYALMAVPLPAGARSVDLTFSSPGFARGRIITLAVLLLLAVVILVDAAGRVRAARAPAAQRG